MNLGRRGAQWQSWTMSKVETTSKVSLEPTTRMNLGRRGAQWQSWTVPKVETTS